MSDRTRRWLSWGAVAVIAAVLSVFLGQWQYSRYETKAANMARVEANFDTDPQALDEVVPGGSFDPASEWSPVSLSGEFIGDPVILPQRGIPGQAGDHVLSLFVTEDEQTVLVDRGWYPVSHAPGDLSAPEGEVTLVARVRPAEDTSGRGVRERQVFAANAIQVIEAQQRVQTPNVAAAVYFMAGDGEPGQEGLGSFPRPAADLGNHLSYAFQWWIFAVGAFVGLGVVIRRDLKAGSGAPPRTKRVSVDIAEEDALIDAQLGQGD